MKRQTGYTLAELVTVAAAIGVGVLFCFLLYIAVHFIMKFW